MIPSYRVHHTGYTYVSSGLAYYAHVIVDSDNPGLCHDKLINQQFTAYTGSPHNDELY